MSMGHTPPRGGNDSPSVRTHMMDAAIELGLDVDAAMSIDDIIAAIKAARRDRVCTIGPYRAGVCTICGGRQPSA